MDEQLTFFDELARDELVVKPVEKPVARTVHRPLTDVPRGHNAERQTSSERNRDAQYDKYQRDQTQLSRRSLTARERVLQEIERCGAAGATREEIAEALEMRLATVCGRCSELLSTSFGKPLVYQDGTRRKGESGKMQVVLRAARGER